MGLIRSGTVAASAFGPLREGKATPRESGLTDDVFRQVIGRELAFPLYLSCSDWDLFDQNVGYEPGRICITSNTNDELLLRPDIYDVACPQDVILAHLYQPYNSGPPFPLHPRANDIVACLADVGPQVNAILAGQWRAEVGFTPKPDGTSAARKLSVTWCTEFVKEFAGKMRDIGVRPAIGLIMHQILLHAYWAERNMDGGDPLKPVLMGQDVLVICFLGHALWGQSGGTMLAVESDKGGRWIRADELDPYPYARLSAWIDGIECWGGMDYMNGLAKDNDLKMKAGGFTAGVIGELPPKEHAKMLEHMGG